MNKAWVDQELENPTFRLYSAEAPEWSLFEPTPDLYERLESGDEDDLTSATNQIGRHLALNSLPSATYEWSLRMKPEVAGQIQQDRIRIPLFYAGKPHALGAILAHELTHKVLERTGISSSLIELEPLTDLTSIALGLGKLVLNGTIVELVAATGEIESLGYLTPELKVYAYLKVNQQHRIPDSIAKKYLTEGAIHLLEGST